jgi:DNA-binding MarR family transcriptional regulator/GNAT superfamily N-acetyltransferase
MSDARLERRVEEVRRFNRFYTRQIGLLEEQLLRSPFKLTEARVLYELGQRGTATATEVGTELSLDAGYLSRIVRGFVRRGLVERHRSEEDGRQTLLCLSGTGRRAFGQLNGAARREVSALLERLPVEGQKRMVTAMQTIQELISAPSERRPSYTLRSHEPGDMGWVVHRHGVLYAEEYGWDERFEALVAGIVARFIERFDPSRERCWIAEQEGERVGSVYCVQKSKTVGQLRLLLVEPRARGLGLGRRLVSECVDFARRAGYRRLVLWTNAELHVARRIYEHAGFELVSESPHHSWGADHVGQYWALKL